MTNKVVIWVGAAIGALLIAVVIVGIVLINTIRTQAEHDAYQDCMSRHGYAADSPPPAVANDDELDDYLGEINAAAEECIR